MPFNLEKARRVHGDRYDYTKVTYIDCATKVEIVCPDHGSFWQEPRKHTQGRGCIKCRDARMRGSFHEEDAHKIHNNRYSYKNVSYVNADTHVEIICPDHGSFWQTPYKHIKNQQGCSKCGDFRAGKIGRLTKDEFVSNARLAHGDRFDYSKTEYVTAKVKVTITCKKHGDFQQTPDCHISSKNGCPKCGFNVSSAGASWIRSFKNPAIIEEHTMTVCGRRFKFDGYDPTTNTVYEYFGVFWHGHPEYTDHTKVNPRNKKAFSKLYADTLDKIKFIQDAGFNLVYEWG